MPDSLDLLSRSGTHYFFVGLIAVINLHHYFIDNVIWRFSNTPVRESLMA